MDLRTGETVWQAMGGHALPACPLAESIACDVLIVGGGITGAFVAYALSQVGVECVLIDQGASGAGSTMASTALVLYELDMHLTDLAERMDPKGAVQCYLACVHGVRTVQQIATEVGAAQYRPRRSFYFGESPSDQERLEREFLARRRAGIEVEFLEARQIERLFPFSRPAALSSVNNGEVNPEELVRCLLGAAERAGAKRFGGTRMVSHRESGPGVRVQTEHGYEIRCRRMVFATGYDSDKYLGFSVAKLRSTFVVSTEAGQKFPGWHGQSLLWTTARPYFYLRTTVDGRAIIGGADIDACSPAVRDAMLPDKAVLLEKELRELFPAAEFKIANAWAGTFAETPDSLACIGKIPSMPWAYFALGYGGNGITYSALAGEILCDLLRGKRNTMARLFGFERFLG